MSVDVKSVNPSKLKTIIQNLKEATDADQMVSLFQTLGNFCTSSDAASGQVLEDVEVSKFISDCIEKHESKAVKIHASAFLVTLSFSVGELKQGFLADTALSMFINIFQEIECPQNLDILEAVEQQLKHAPYSPRTLEGAVSIIQKLTSILSSNKIPENSKKRVVDILADILDGDFFMPVLYVERAAPSFSASSSSSLSSLPPSSSSPSTSSSFSSSFSSNTAPPECPFAFLLALGHLYNVLVALAAKTRGRLSIYSLGLCAKLKERFGEKVENGTIMEEEEKRRKEKEKEEKERGGKKDETLSIVFDADSSSKGTFSQCICKMVGSSWGTVFVKEPLVKGTFKIVLKIIQNCGQQMFGVAPQSQKSSQANSYLGQDSTVNSCGLYLCDTYTSAYFEYGVKGTNHASTFPLKNVSMISVELDATSRTVHFFLDGKIFPSFITNTPAETLVFAISCYGDGEYEVISLQKLAKSSVPISSGLTALAMH